MGDVKWVFPPNPCLEENKERNPKWGERSEKERKREGRGKEIKRKARLTHSHQQRQHLLGLAVNRDG
jgi:hypothetical protein